VSNCPPAVSWMTCWWPLAPKKKELQSWNGTILDTGCPAAAPILAAGQSRPDGLRTRLAELSPRAVALRPRLSHLEGNPDIKCAHFAFDPVRTFVGPGRCSAAGTRDRLSSEPNGRP